MLLAQWIKVKIVTCTLTIFMFGSGELTLLLADSDCDYGAMLGCVLPADVSNGQAYLDGMLLSA
jgi:hypothetical protein